MRYTLALLSTFSLCANILVMPENWALYFALPLGFAAGYWLVECIKCAD